MSKAEPDTHEQEKTDLIDTLTGTLDRLKARLDELRVQADLAKLDTRERVSTQLEVAQNACLAAYSKLRDARTDLSINVDSIGTGLQKVVEDVKQAIEAAQAVISRG